MSTEPLRYYKPAIREERNGFTLVELLVTIFIIGILVAILVPVVSYALKRSYQTRMQLDIMEIMMAIDEFEQDGFDLDGDGRVEAHEQVVPLSLTQLIDARRPARPRSDGEPGTRYLQEATANRITRVGDNEYELQINSSTKALISYLIPPVVENFPRLDSDSRYAELSCPNYDPDRYVIRLPDGTLTYRFSSRNHCASRLVLLTAQLEDDDEGEVRGKLSGSSRFIRFSEFDDSSVSVAKSPYTYVSTSLPLAELSAEEIEDRLQQVQLKAMALIVELLLDNEADLDYLRSLKEDAADPEIVIQATAILDADSNGVIRCDDLHQLAYGDKLPNTPDFRKVKLFLQDALETLELTPCPDLEDGYGIEPSYLYGKGFVVDDVLSFDQLCELTRSLCDKPGVAKALCAKLAVARGAVTIHDNIKARDNSLKAYRKLVYAQKYKSLNAEEADVLITASQIMQTASD